MMATGSVRGKCSAPQFGQMPLVAAGAQFASRCRNGRRTVRRVPGKQAAAWASRAQPPRVEQALHVDRAVVDRLDVFGQRLEVSAGREPPATGPSAKIRAGRPGRHRRRNASDRRAEIMPSKPSPSVSAECAHRPSTSAARAGSASALPTESSLRFSDWRSMRLPAKPTNWLGFALAGASKRRKVHAGSRRRLMKVERL